MRIVMGDGRMFQGTALQIVRAMQDAAFAPGDFTVPQYVAWAVDNARRQDDKELEVKGTTDDELAASLVSEMLRTGLSKKI